jgi:hypothetical protein
VAAIRPDVARATLRASLDILLAPRGIASAGSVRKAPGSWETSRHNTPAPIASFACHCTGGLGSVDRIHRRVLERRRSVVPVVHWAFGRPGDREVPNVKPADGNEQRRARKVNPMIRNRLVLPYTVFRCSVALGLLACNDSSLDGRRGNAVTTSDVSSEAGPPGACEAPLVSLQTGGDSSCGGGNEHSWPVGLEADDCHGWRAVDTTGRQHDNSANSISCNVDGSFSFVQFAGNLNCVGTGVLKTYVPDECAQDTPPSLYTVATNLACCSAPDSAECTTGTPGVTVPGATIYLNATPCTP